MTGSRVAGRYAHSASSRVRPFLWLALVLLVEVMVAAVVLQLVPQPLRALSAMLLLPLPPGGADGFLLGGE